MRAEHAVRLHAEMGTAQLRRLAAYQRLGGALLIEPDGELPELQFRIAVATALLTTG